MPAVKLSKLLGLTNVLRTFVDVEQLPVSWWFDARNVEKENTDNGENYNDNAGDEQDEILNQYGSGIAPSSPYKTSGFNSTEELGSISDSFHPVPSKRIEYGLHCEYSTASANSYIAEAGQVQFLQAAVEQLAQDMGFERKAAIKESVISVIGEEAITSKATTSPTKFTQTTETQTKAQVKQFEEDGLAYPLQVWENMIAKYFHEIFAKEVFAKDLPSFIELEE